MEGVENLEDDLVAMWKIKRLIKNISDMRGSGTSMISMYLPPKKDAMNKANKTLSDQESSAVNIKSSANKAGVLTAITSIREKLRLYKSIPENGLVLFCGTVEQEGKDAGKKFTMDFQPFKPITS